MGITMRAKIYYLCLYMVITKLQSSIWVNIKILQVCRNSLKIVAEINTETIKLLAEESTICVIPEYITLNYIYMQ